MKPSGQEFSFTEPQRPATRASPPALIPEDTTMETISQKPHLDNLSDPADFKLLNEQLQKDTSGMYTDAFFTATPTKPSKSNKSGTKHSGSKMSDPNMYRSGPDHPPNYGESTFCGQLLMFTVNHNLPCPQFMNFNKFDPKTKHASYMCKIKIGEHLNFSSCPFASSLLQEAQEHVAEMAYQELCRRYEHMETAALPVTKDRQEIISRVTEIVSPHTAGLKSESVETKYKLMHQEKLPSDWLTIIKDLSLLSVEKLVGGNFVYPAEDGKIPPNVTKLPPLVLPEDDHWPVFITYCLSTNSVYFRIVNDDYNGAYESMSEQMDEIYNSARDQLHPVDVVKEGNFYAAFLNGQWFRVKALSGILGENVRVSLIDHGDTDDILKEVIYPLDERLVRLPAQAIRCGLHNLEQYYTDSYVSQTVYDTIIGQALMAKVESRNPHLLLTLFDTNGDEDINCNEKIKEQIQAVLSPPKVPAKGNVKSVYLTSVQEDGHAYVQIISDCFKFLKSLMASVNQELSKNEKNYVMKSVNELVGGKVFLAKYHGDGLWHRATVRSLIHDNQVEVMFVDYGNIEIVPLECMASIQHFTDVLGAIAYQAVEVQLVKPTNELFTQTIIEFLMGISQSGGDGDNSQRLFMMKVIKDDPVPDVELSLRMSDTNKLVALNDIIGTYYPEYRSLTFKAMESTSDVLERLPQIKPFVVSSVGQPFNVFVSMVSHPTHFIVQPLEYRERLQLLTEKMKQYYYSERPVVDVNMITVGQAFAVERSDGKWCRGIVTLVMPDLNSVSIKCVDYGDTLSVNYQSIYVLLPCFRELPAVAIKAELAGIRPVHRDWNMNDSIRFKDLVAHKSFVAVPVEVNEDSVSMILLDTSTESQIDIGAVLVDEGRARDITVDEL